MEITQVEFPLVLSKKLIARQGFYLKSKRTLDVIVSALGLVFLIPLFLVVSIIIKLTSKGSILYWSKRCGVNGKEMWFPKFRSMINNAEQLKQSLLDQNEHKDGHTFKIKKDPRITVIGSIIRKLSIDELPQLILVLKGDMSLVGPRPALMSEVESYTDIEKQRLLVKPGLTCFWQVSGRGDIPFDEQLKMDIDYFL